MIRERGALSMRMKYGAVQLNRREISVTEPVEVFTGLFRKNFSD
jgi:hypothetical protein